MVEVALWRLAIAVVSIATVGGSTPASAWDGINRFGIAGGSLGSMVRALPSPTRNRIGTAHIMARSFGRENGLRVHRNDQLQNGFPVAVWPYLPSTDTTPTDVTSAESEPSAGPQVIILSSSSQGEPLAGAAKAQFDHSYAGCHAIPNGYHCDMP
jgi:hypothetical protein